MILKRQLFINEFLYLSVLILGKLEFVPPTPNFSILDSFGGNNTRSGWSSVVVILLKKDREDVNFT